MTRPKGVLASQAPGSHHWPCLSGWGATGPGFGGERSMKLGSLTRRLGLAAVAFLVVAACGSSPSNGSASCSESTAKTASAATACGGMDALVALANTAKFTPYKVATWSDIPAGAKEPTGLWFNDYGGYMGIGYDSSKVPAITSVSDLLGSAFKSKVALAGDPTKSNQGLNGVIMASVANGGSLDDVSKGVDFFKQLKQKGNYVPVVGTAATVKAGQTPVLFEWDYLSTSHGKDVSTWKIFVPTNAIIGGFYNQAINKDAPHPAAARLWEEYLYSDEGQNLWLKGGARPIRQAAMTTAGTVDTASAAKL